MECVANEECRTNFFPFFRLPGELRVLVLRLILCSKTLRRLYGSHEASSSALNILQTNRRVYAEASRILYSHCRFDILGHDLHGISRTSTKFRYIKRLVLTISWLAYGNDYTGLYDHEELENDLHRLSHLLTAGDSTIQSLDVVWRSVAMENSDVEEAYISGIRPPQKLCQMFLSHLLHFARKHPSIIVNVETAMPLGQRKRSPGSIPDYESLENFTARIKTFAEDVKEARKYAVALFPFKPSRAYPHFSPLAFQRLRHTLPPCFQPAKPDHVTELIAFSNPLSSYCECNCAGC